MKLSDARVLAVMERASCDRVEQAATEVTNAVFGCIDGGLICAQTNLIGAQQAGLHLERAKRRHDVWCDRLLAAPELSDYGVFVAN